MAIKILWEILNKESEMDSGRFIITLPEKKNTKVFIKKIRKMENGPIGIQIIMYGKKETIPIMLKMENGVIGVKIRC